MNLIPAPRREKKARRRRVRWWATRLTIYAAALVVAGLVRMSTAGRCSRALADEDKLLTAKLNSARQVLLGLKHELSDTRGKLESIRTVGKQPDWGVMLRLVADKLGDEAVLDHCALRHIKRASDDEESPGGRRIVLDLSGLARSQAAVADFILRLEKTGLFARVKLLKTNRRTFEGERIVTFWLECLLSGS